MRMGGFHIAQNFLGAIGHLMLGTEKIMNILVEAGVCLHETANTITSEKEYYAMLRAHTIVHAVIFTLHWEAFVECLIQ